jgi:hypothetical protein
MNPVSYRIPLTDYEINSEGPLNLALEQLQKVRKHLYLAANMTYQHYFQLLKKGEEKQRELFFKYNEYQNADRKAWEVLNDAKLKYAQVGIASNEERQSAKSIIEKLPEDIKLIRDNSKRDVYKFIKEDSFIEKLTEKFNEIIPADIMEHSMSKVLQELYTDYEFIQKDLQPLRVYGNSFPICFGWQDNLIGSFKWLDEIKYGEKTVQFYLFQWLDHEQLSFKCRIGKRLPELANILSKITTGEISYHNCGDPSILCIRNRKWVLQFNYKPDPINITPDISGSVAMGIDLGYKMPIAWAITDNDNSIGSIGDGDEIKEERNRVQFLYKAQIAALNQTRKGQGRGRKSVVLKKRAIEEKKYFRQLNAKWAHDLIEIAEKNKVAIIKVEDLDFKKKKEDLKRITKENNLKLTQRGTQKIYRSMPDNLLTMYRNWSYGDLISKIEHAAAQKNIIVARVNPYGTSRHCWKCGEKGIRNRQAYLQFTKKQAHQCQYKSLGNCVLCEYDQKETERQRKALFKMGKNKENSAGEIYTHYLAADFNAARRIANAIQYNIYAESKIK